jgi:sugar (pentulose or hexulose) kinase
MADSKQYIAVDLGAESGRVMLGTLTAENLNLFEVHRFANSPLEQDESIRWNFPKLMTEIKTGIGLAVKQSDGNVAGIGIDSWGVDFGLIDKNGSLIENPYHYRDSRTNGILEKAFKLMGKRDIYAHTGIQFMQINSVYQLLVMRLANSPSLARARNLIFTADLVAYHLCGKIFSEYTLASTSQLLDMKTGQWSRAVFDKLSLPLEIMPEIVQPCTVVGQLTNDLSGELGCDAIPVIAVGSHDTACAVVGVPVAGNSNNWAYISSGTWSLMGLEIPKAIINDKTFEYEFTNEGGANNTIRLLKNLMGMWLVQECRREWLKHGDELSYGELTEMAQQSEPFVAKIDIDYHEFLAPGEMPAKINRYLKQTGQKTIDEKGQMIRAVLESLAFKYRWVLNKLEAIRGQEVKVLHIVGGGIQNELLCQFAANATGKEVITGPIEATACGNIIMQAKATGQIASLSQGRGIIRNSYPLKKYPPANQQTWDTEYKKNTW